MKNGYASLLLLGLIACGGQSNRSTAATHTNRTSINVDDSEDELRPCDQSLALERGARELGCPVDQVEIDSVGFTFEGSTLDGFGVDGCGAHGFCATGDNGDCRCIRIHAERQEGTARCLRLAPIL